MTYPVRDQATEGSDQRAPGPGRRAQGDGRDQGKDDRTQNSGFRAQLTDSGIRRVTHGPEWTAKVQRAWAERPLKERLQILRKFRHRIAQRANALCAAIAAPARTDADVRVTEILPLLAACEFLEDNAEKILKARCLSSWGRPLWLWGVRSEVQRSPLGRVLVIGPSNYPLFLPGVQVLQALAAGNAVTWKPGRGGRAVAKVVAEELMGAGLPRELLRLTEETEEAGRMAIEAGADKVFFTGSSQSGRAVMRQLAETATPSVMELSGCAAVIVMPSGDLARAAAAIVFGMRLNGAATCMAPRRLLVMDNTTARREALVRRLQDSFMAVPPAMLQASVLNELRALVNEAQAEGATLIGEVARTPEEGQSPILLIHAKPEMRVARVDIFAPVLCVFDVADTPAIGIVQRASPFALTTSIFGKEAPARRLARKVVTGTVIINDVIVPSADPRIPFGGRRASGFGVTRGLEGLLEMTAVKTVLVRRGDSERHYEPTSEAHVGLFDGLILAGHSRTWRERWRGLRQLVSAARTLQPEPLAVAPVAMQETHVEE